MTRAVLLAAGIAMCLTCGCYDKAKHHCKPTGKQRESMIIVQQYCGDNCWMPMPMWFTEHEYMCDDGRRWL